MWIASAIATAVLLAATFVLIPPASKPPANPALTPAPKDQAPKADPGTCTSTGTGTRAALIRFIIAYGLFGFGYIITATFVSSIARTTPSLAPVEPIAWLIVGVCAAPSIWFWNRISARFGARTAFAAACLLEAAGIALTVVSADQTLFLVGAAIFGITFMGITALGLMEARRMTLGQDPLAVRRMLALVTTCFGVGQMAGPAVAGQLHGLTGSFQAGSLAAAGALVMAALLAAR